MDIFDKLRSGHVRRWHIVAVSREQTVAEHMHRVGVIAEDILRALGLFDWDSSITLNTMRLAAIHDRHEFRLGDIPTPGKELIRAELETVHIGDVFDLAAAELDPEYAELAECCSIGGECPLAGLIVKYADILEAMNYLGIFGVGSHARDVWDGLQVAAGNAVQHLVKAIYEEREADGSASYLMSLIPALREGTHWK